MSFGARCVNGSSQLTLSSDGYLLGYLGKASLVSITPAGTSTGGANQSYATYSFTWGAPIVCGIRLEGIATSQGSCIDSFTNSGSTWTIKVRHTDLSTNSVGLAGQLASADVHVWGLPVALSGFGAVLFDSLGNLSGDLLRRPLTFDKVIAMDVSTTVTPIAGYIKPVVIGAPNMQRTTTTGTAPLITNRRWNSLWQWDDSTSNLDRKFAVSNYEQSADPIIVTSHVYPASALILEGANLPA